MLVDTSSRKGIENLFFAFRKGGEEEFIGDLRSSGRGESGDVKRGSEEGDGLKHSGVGNREGDDDKELHFEKEKFADIVGEIEVDVFENTLTHTDWGGAEDATFHVPKGAVASEERVEFMSIGSIGKGVGTSNDKDVEGGVCEDFLSEGMSGAEIETFPSTRKEHYTFLARGVGMVFAEGVDKLESSGSGFILGDSLVFDSDTTRNGDPVKVVGGIENVEVGVREGGDNIVLREADANVEVEKGRVGQLLEEEGRGDTIRRVFEERDRGVLLEILGERVNDSRGIL